MFNSSVALSKPSLTREEWLEAAIKLLVSDFKKHAVIIPNCRVSVGFGLGRGSRNKIIGQHWHPRAASDNSSQIFISPILSDGIQALETLVHELIHAVYPDDGHGKSFKQLARSLGLEGKLTATKAGASLKARLEAIEAVLGSYPHARLNPSQSGIKKQTTRLLKLVCPYCDYTIRVSQKWIDTGLPVCHCGGEFGEDL